MKDLPKVFANPNAESASHNRAYSYGKLEDSKMERNEKIVRDKIDKIFKSDTTAYSIDCIVKFAKDEKKYTIIGKTAHHLVTKNQDLIPIVDVYDIELA